MSDDKYTPDDGPAYVGGIDFTLGEPYTAQDMYRDMGIGSRVAYEKDGMVYTDTVSSVSYSSGEYVPAPDRSWWQRAARALTPRRWRKPLPQPTRKPSTVTVTVGDKAPDHERHMKTLADMQAMIGKFEQ